MESGEDAAVGAEIRMSHVGRFYNVLHTQGNTAEVVSSNGRSFGGFNFAGGSLPLARLKGRDAGGAFTQNFSDALQQPVRPVEGMNAGVCGRFGF